MPIRILFLEDEAGYQEYVSSDLRELGFAVDDCFRIDQAKELFEESKDDIDCVVVDLNMDDRWLGEYKNESFGGFFSGAVWLEHFVFKSKPNIPTIIFSGYCDLLKREKPYLCNKQNVRCVNKGIGENSGFEGLLKALEDLLGFDGLMEVLENRPY